MTLDEYLVYRNGTSANGKPITVLSNYEKMELGITHQKGWHKKHKDDVIPEHLIGKLFAWVEAYKNSKKFREQQPEHFKHKQKVYLMLNEIGNYKIGISNDPKYRKNALETASGIKITIVAYWGVEDKAINIEKKLHKHFKQYRKLGEWFTFPDNFDVVKEIETFIPCFNLRLY